MQSCRIQTLYAPSSAMADESPTACHQCEHSDQRYNENDLRVHRHTVHLPGRENWPILCPWVPCISLPLLTEPARLTRHVKVVHKKDVWCRYLGCSYGLPFGTSSDMERHYIAKHEDPVHCEIPGCQSRFSTVARRDRRREHNARWHGPFCCSVAGCLRGCIEGQNHGFATLEGLEDHIRRPVKCHHIVSVLKIHGPLDCLADYSC